MNSSIDPIKTGRNIKKYRKRKGLSVDAVSKELNLNAVQSVYKWERGDSVPRLDNFFALCYLLEVSPADICVFYDDEYAQGINEILKNPVELSIPKKMEYYATEEAYCCPNCGCPVLKASDTECPVCGQAVYNLNYMAQDLGVSVEVAKAMMMNCIIPNNQVLDEKTKMDIAESIKKSIEDNKPKIANVAVANFDGNIAYTLKKKVGGRV